LLSDATSKAQPPPFTRAGDWIVYPASSPSYRPPVDLDVLIKEPVSKRYEQAGMEIVLHKTPAYLLTSLSIPSPVGKDENALHSTFIPYNSPMLTCLPIHLVARRFAIIGCLVKRTPVVLAYGAANY